MLVTALSNTESTELNLGALLRDLITEWDRRQAGLTQARKREMLDRVLSASGSQADKLVERLNGMLRSWSRNGDDELPGGDAVPALGGSVRPRRKLHGYEPGVSDGRVPVEHDGVSCVDRCVCPGGVLHG